MKKTHIYGLYSTRNEIIRYIGKSNDPKLRLKGHIWTSINNKSNSYKSCWIRKEISDGYEIKYKILETCYLDEWVSKEIEHISNYENLTNHHKGGLGGSPLTYNKTYSELKEWVDNELPKEINSHKNWKKYIKSNYYGKIPINPNKVYKNAGWTCWADFLNTRFYHTVDYVTYEEFKIWVIKNVKSYKEFKKIKKPYGITSKPEKTYNDVWVGWIYIFNNAFVFNKDLYWDYDTSKKYLNDKYGNITLHKFKKLCKYNELPYHIPKNPERFYPNFNYKEFLNLNYIPYLDYETAKQIVHTFNIKTNKDWRIFIKENKLPLNIPRSPTNVYKNEWTSWYEWLGNKKK